MTIAQRTRTPRPRVKRLQPGFDRLDDRLVLSTSSTTAGLGAVVFGSPTSGQGLNSPSDSLQIIATDPATSTTLATSPRSLSITFDRPIDPFSVGNADFKIVPLASDGSVSQTVSGASYDEAIDPADSTQSRIILTLDSRLNSGKYELLLVGANQLQAQDGTAIASTGQDRGIDHFRVGTPSVGLASAVDLGTVGSSVSVASGSLDLAANPDAVQLYKVELAPGHFQRLGLEISTTGDVAKLSTTLSLFDAHEKLISTSIPTPNDPYLFAGLAPGTYYVGVSGAGNVPGPTGGYQSSASTSVVSTVEQSGGTFALSYVSDVVTQPTHVVGLDLDHADPGSTSPTGFTIDFSGTLQTQKLQDAANPAVVLVDQSGQAWPLAVTRYDTANARLSVIFNESLPAGHYTVEAGGAGALVDLAGLAPVATHQLSGVLGGFDVAPGTLAPGDLGVVYPSLAQAGLGSSVTITPAATYNGQFTVVKPGVYVIKQTGSPLGLTVSTASETTPGSVIQASQTPEGLLMILPAGVFSLSATNDQNQSVLLSFQIQEKATPFTSLLDTGVGQGPALNLRLVAPSASGSVNAGNSNSGSTGVDLPSGPSVSSFSTSGQVGVGTPSQTLNLTAPTGSLIGFVVVGTPFGRPTMQFDQISVVGPATNSSLGAVAVNTDGLPGGLVMVPTRISFGLIAEPQVPPLNDLTPVPNPPSRANLTPASQGEDLFNVNSEGDNLSLNDAAWVERILAWTVAKLEGVASLGGEVPATPAPAHRFASGLERVVAEAEGSRMEMASLASPLGLGLALIVTIRYRKRQASLAKTAGLNPGVRASNRFFRGPHRGRFLSR